MALSKKKKPSEDTIPTPISERVAQEEPTKRQGGREQSIPSVLRRKQPVSEYDWDAEEVESGIGHRSSADDSLVSIEDFDGVRELLHPGRNAAELDARTDLSTTEIIVYAQGRVFASRFGCKIIDDYISHLERLSLSHNRKSRKELTRALAGVVERDNQAVRMLDRLG